jgi:hypothetical protein
MTFAKKPAPRDPRGGRSTATFSEDDMNPTDPTDPNDLPEFLKRLDPEALKTLLAQIAHNFERWGLYYETLLGRGWPSKNAIQQEVQRRLQARGVAPINAGTAPDGRPAVAYSFEQYHAGLSDLVASGARGDGR